MLWTEYLCPPKIHIEFEALAPNVAVFGGEAFEEVIKVKWGHKHATLIW